MANFGGGGLQLGEGTAGGGAGAAPHATGAGPGAGGVSVDGDDDGDSDGGDDDDAWRCAPEYVWVARRLNNEGNNTRGLVRDPHLFISLPLPHLARRTL